MSHSRRLRKEDTRTPCALHRGETQGADRHFLHNIAAPSQAFVRRHASVTLTVALTLISQVFNDDETKKTFYYKLNVPTLAQGISMAVGPFEVLPDPKIGYVTHFCLPGKMKQLINCVSFFHQVLRRPLATLCIAYTHTSLSLGHSQHKQTHM